jgi:hypothetical protein
MRFLIYIIFIQDTNFKEKDLIIIIFYGCDTNYLHI